MCVFVSAFGEKCFWGIGVLLENIEQFIVLVLFTSGFCKIGFLKSNEGTSDEAYCTNG